MRSPSIGYPIIRKTVQPLVVAGLALLSRQGSLQMVRKLVAMASNDLQEELELFLVVGQCPVVLVDESNPSLSMVVDHGDSSHMS